MRLISFVLAMILSVLFNATLAVADDCENLNEQKICWGGSTSTTLSWTYPRTTIGGFQIEVRDFDWMGSISISISKDGIVKNGVLSEGESYVFDFSNNSTFDGIKLIADKVSNINTFPANIGTFPADPRAKISSRLSIPEEKKRPTLELAISTERKTETDRTITACLNIKNSGESDLVDTDVRIFFEGLEVMNEYDFEKGTITEVIASGQEIKWKNVSSYKLTPANPYIIKDRYFIKVLNFSNKNSVLNISYNGSMRNYALREGDSIVSGFKGENEYVGIRILGIHISNDTAELKLQYPEKNSLIQKYPIIFAKGSESIKLRFRIPFSSRKTYTISANASAKDREGNDYTISASSAVSLQDTFTIKKTASDSILGEKLYPEFTRVGDIASIRNITYVTISVYNPANYPLYGVKLKDTILPGYNVVNDLNSTAMSWNFDINASEHKEFTYAITAKRQGIYNLPKAQLSWNEFGEDFLLESNSPRTTVSGPYIVMERSFNRSTVDTGDTLSVSLSITNNGDLPINITVNDNVPQNATFLSGTLSFSDFLRPGENARIIYAVTVNENIIEFKPPEMLSKNDGFEWYEPLPSKKISGYSSVQTAIPEIIPETEKATHPPQSKGIITMVNEKFPWLEGAISIISLLLGILLLLMMNKTKYFKTYEK